MAREINDHKPEWVLDKVEAAIADALAKKTGSAMADIKVACLGLAFKPGIDDLRESPAVEITQHIAQLGCQVLAVEPNMATLIILAYLMHTVLQWSDGHYQQLRERISARQRFFNDLRSR